MCTVTWERSAEGYELYFSRDERFSRQPAVPPRVVQLGDLRCLAPFDGDFGGTWIGVNELGLTACLLNGSDSFKPANRVESRGRLVVRALACNSVDAFASCLDATDLGSFRAFTLLGVSAQGSCAALMWNGRKLVRDTGAELGQPFTSSSFEPERVIPYRKGLFQSSSQRGSAFHASHAGGPGPLSVCMHRPDARTVSFTQVSVRRDHVSMLYSPHPPCQGIVGDQVHVMRDVAL